MLYLLSKSLHLFFVMAWVAAVFYLPRILVNLAEARGQGEVERRLYLMGRRLYGFGHVMFGLSLALGLVLWFGFGMVGGWLHGKLALLILLLGYYTWTGRLLKRAEAGAALPGSTWMRWYNEAPIPLLLGILYLAIAKPF